MKKVLMIVAGLGVFGICTTAALSAQSQAWNQVISGTGRFLPLIQFNNEAVLDKETGLVWQQAPLEGQWSWGPAQFYCTHLTVANRRGWRVPTVQELESLIDPSSEDLALPAGHPFGAVDPSSYYWSSTVDAFDQSLMWVMTFADGSTERGPRCAPGTGCGAPRLPISVWCVRGGQGADAQ